MRTRIAWALVVVLVVGQFVWHSYSIVPQDLNCFQIRFTTVWGLFSVLSEKYCPGQAIADVDSDFPTYPP